MSAPAKVDIHWGLPTRRCECEHSKHFGTQGTGRKIDGHAYGADFPRKHIHPVSTPYGTFHVCPACAQTCYAKYVLQPHDEAAEHARLEARRG